VWVQEVVPGLEAFLPQVTSGHLAVAEAEELLIVEALERMGSCIVEAPRRALAGEELRV